MPTHTYAPPPTLSQVHTQRNAFKHKSVICLLASSVYPKAYYKYTGSPTMVSVYTHTTPTCYTHTHVHTLTPIQTQIHNLCLHVNIYTPALQQQKHCIACDYKLHGTPTGIPAGYTFNIYDSLTTYQWRDPGINIHVSGMIHANGEFFGA